MRHTRAVSILRPARLETISLPEDKPLEPTESLMPDTKIATCCYCGHRAALQLRGAVRHELACSNCGAPLHDLKMIPTAKVGAKRQSAPPKPPPHRLEPRPLESRWQKAESKREKKKHKKPRKSLAKRFFEEAFDVIEDIFD